MDTSNNAVDARDVASGVPLPPAGESIAEQVLPWEQIADGRYMPRRIRGSCLGRELG
jgi:hypothetical protein